jgi:hypothetical protein
MGLSFIVDRVLVLHMGLSFIVDRVCFIHGS